jgi:hypothetical protein
VARTIWNPPADVEERGLADPGLSADDECSGVAGFDVVQQPLQQPALV